MSGKKKICRLCLTKIDNDYEVLDDNTMEVFKVLLLETDLFLTGEHVMCRTCTRCIQDAFDFKSACFYVDELVVSFSLSRNACKLDMREVYLNENKAVSPAIAENYNVCRFCMICLEDNNFSPLNDLPEDVLLKCIPEVDLNIITQPVICTCCVESLKCYFNFAMNCQSAEDRIKKYCKTQGVDNKRQIILSDVHTFFNRALEYTSDCSKRPVIKNVCLDVNDNVVKIEELRIKDERETAEDVDFKNTLYPNKGDVEMSTKFSNTSKISSSHLKIYNCDICKFKTESKNNLKRHILTHNDSLAEKTSPVHNRTLIKKGNPKVVTYKCNLCTFETKYKGNLKQHKIKHKDWSEVDAFKCDICRFVTKRKRNLKIHILIHKDGSEVTMYKCERCTFETKNKETLKSHLVVHKNRSQIRMYKCKLCTFETKHRSSFHHHVSTHKTDAEVNTFKCGKCSFDTKHKWNLKVHMLTHMKTSEVKMYKCHLCKFETIYKTSHKSHLLTHKDISDLNTSKCQICRGEGKHHTSLSSHVMTHKNCSDETVYECEICDLKSRCKRNMRRHMLTHKNSFEVPMYKCETQVRD